MRDYNVYIEQILEMIGLLKETNLDKMREDRLILDATAMRLQILGEAVKNIPIKIRKKYSHILWDSLIKTRDFVSHNYAMIDVDIMLPFIRNRIIPLERELKKILKQENKEVGGEL